MRHIQTHRKKFRSLQILGKIHKQCGKDQILTHTLHVRKCKVHSMSCQMKSFSPGIVILNRQKPETLTDTEKKTAGRCDY